MKLVGGAISTVERGELTFSVDPICVQIWQSRLIAHMLYSFWGFVIQQTARPPSPTSLEFAHCFVFAARTWRFATRVVGDGARKEDWGRQFGGIRKIRLERGVRSGEQAVLVAMEDVTKCNAGCGDQRELYEAGYSDGC
jgi:hypothetical protein